MGNLISDYLGGISKDFLFSSETSESSSSTNTNQTTLIDISNWIFETSWDYTYLRGGQDSDGSYWYRGVLVLWPEASGQKYLIIDSKKSDGQKFWISNLTVNCKESLAHLNDNIDIEVRAGAYHLFDGAGSITGFTTGNRQQTEIYNQNMSIQKVVEDGYHNVEVFLNAQTQTYDAVVQANKYTAVFSTTLFNGFADTSVTPAAGPFYFRVEYILLDMAVETKLIVNLCVFSATSTISLSTTQDNTIKSSKDVGFSSFIGANASGEVGIKIKLTGKDVVDIFTFDLLDIGKDLAAGDSPVKETDVKVDDAVKKDSLKKLLKKAFGSVANALIKLFEKGEIDITASVSGALGLFASFGYSYEENLKTHTLNEFKTIATVKVDKVEQYMISFKREQASQQKLAGTEVIFLALAFDTGEFELTAKQKLVIKTQWDSLTENQRQKIVGKEVNLSNTTLQGSASNLDFAGDANDTKNKELARKRAGALYDYVFGPEVIGSNGQTYDHSFYAQNKPTTAVAHDYADRLANDNSESCRFAQLNIVFS